MYSGLTISGFDFGLSWTDHSLKHFSFLQRVGFILGSNFLLWIRLCYNCFLHSWSLLFVCLFSKQHAVGAARLAASNFDSPFAFRLSNYEALEAYGGPIEPLIKIKQLARAQGSTLL